MELKSVSIQTFFKPKKLNKMVTVIGYAVRQRKDGTTFIALELSGGLEMQQSQTTGNFYATTKRCSIPSTFDENFAKMMVGEKIEGDVVRVEAEPYEFVNKRGEIMLLQHSYAYRPKGSVELIGNTQVSDLQLA
jgi:hypothetical protein